MKRKQPESYENFYASRKIDRAQDAMLRTRMHTRDFRVLRIKGPKSVISAYATI